MKGLKQTIDEQGFSHIPYCQDLTSDMIVSECGQILFQTMIKENRKSTRLLSGNGDVDFHTDHIKAKYILWQCQSQSANGGESLLIDTRDILSNLNSQHRNALSRVVVNCHQLFYGDQSYYPLLSDESRIFYAPFLCSVPGNTDELLALSAFQNRIRTANRIEIKLSEGDWLLIDNHRMLHGRNAFPSGSNRILTRYWLTDK